MDSRETARGRQKKPQVNPVRVEFLAALDSDGNPLAEPVSRPEAHRRGIWHRAVTIFVLNHHGEVLIERRSENKDLFPGYYDLVGGHLHPGETPLEAAKQEIHEEIGLKIEEERLKLVVPVDGVIERVMLPEKSIINLERKTIYLLQLSPEDEANILCLDSQLRQLTPVQLEERGSTGEVSQIEFWSWERLLSLARSSQHRTLASGALSALGDQRVRDTVSRHCVEVRTQRRREFVKKWDPIDGVHNIDDGYDRKLFEQFLEWPVTSAPVEVVMEVFENGLHQQAGAYEIGSFRRIVAGDVHWGAKLLDPEGRYVRNLLATIGWDQPVSVSQKLEQTSGRVQAFVGDLLNLPLADGSRFRDGLGNLAEIAAARKAALFLLEREVPDLSKEVFNFPTSVITEICRVAGEEILAEFLKEDSTRGMARFRELVLSGIGASIADFNSPSFQEKLKLKRMDPDAMKSIIRDMTVQEFCPELGCDEFLEEFHSRFVASQEKVTIAYLAGNTAQAALSLAIAQYVLTSNPRAKILFVPKTGSPGNDLTFNDAEKTLASDRGLFASLIHFREEGRFSLELDGPQGHGLDPGRLSSNLARVLSDADVILAEGQAYAEIRGWQKPAYIAFRVNGRVAEAIHGVSRLRGALAFVRLTPGVDHFWGFNSIMKRTIPDQAGEGPIPVAEQTTREYVQAVLSENLKLIVEHLFQGDHIGACQHLASEARTLGRTFAQILIGIASRRPDRADVAKAVRDKRFPVFACGGGGGFSSVTLKALRSLSLPVVAGVPSTDDGGSTGELQDWFRDHRGFVFGVGDMAAILEGVLTNHGKRAVLAYRFAKEPESLTKAVIARIVEEWENSTYPDGHIGAADDFLSFVCDQMNFARIIQDKFRKGRAGRLPVKGASIRNLNVIAAYELCDCLGTLKSPSDESRLDAYYVLQKALGIPEDLLVLPVTYEGCVLGLDFEYPVSKDLATAFEIPPGALANGRKQLLGQKYIDKLPQPGRRLSVFVSKSRNDTTAPVANPAYLARLREAQLFVMGAGSLIGSQLAQLVVPGIVDVLLERKDMRRILVMNHVKMDETLGMSLRDQIELLEFAATESASADQLQYHELSDGRLQVSDLFTDIVVPRTIARELEAEMAKSPTSDAEEKRVLFVHPETGEELHLFGNRYVRFLQDNPDVCLKYRVTMREVEVLSYLEQPMSLYDHRSEKGRYRGALFATSEDVAYLERRGIQLRSIHEVDAIGEITKFVKREGASTLEFFPGLIPEALVGIFRIALERANTTLGSGR